MASIDRLFVKLLLLGINHKTAHVDIREQYFLRPNERELLLTLLKNNPAVVGAYVLSTCNRTEIYADLIHDDVSPLIHALFKVKHLELPDKLSDKFYVLKDNAVVEHLMKVSCGLDSLVIGEKQILGQVKLAQAFSAENAFLSKPLNILINLAIRAGKLSQTLTDISVGGSSVSWAAVAMAQKIMGSLQDKNILIVGAGKMSQLTAEQLSRKNAGQIFVINRTDKKAKELADRLGGEAVPFWDIKDVLCKIDVCICSAGAPHYIIDNALVEYACTKRANKPLLMVDVSTPRNIEPKVNRLPGVHLVSIDDLENVVEENMDKRRSAITHVEQIVKEKTEHFYSKMSRTHQSVPA